MKDATGITDDRSHWVLHVGEVLPFSFISSLIVNSPLEEDRG